MTLAIGTTFQHYQILYLVYRSDVNALYRAFDTQLNRSVTIEELLPGRACTEEFINDVQIQIARLQQVQHPNLARILDYGPIEKTIYLVYDFSARNTLQPRMNRPQDWSMAAHILAPITEALSTLHRQKLVHGGIKPQYIVLSQDSQPYLYHVGFEEIIMKELRRLTAGMWTGIGPSRYLAPEQVVNSIADPRSDIYALGVIFHELISGKPLFLGDTSIERIVQQAIGHLPRRIDSDLPDVVEKILRLCLIAQPEHRLQNADHLAFLLRSLERKRHIPHYRLAKRDHGVWLLVVTSLFILVAVLTGGWLVLDLTGSTQKFVEAIPFIPSGTPTVTITPPSSATPSPSPSAIPSQTRAPTATASPTSMPTPTPTPENLPVIFDNDLPNVRSAITSDTILQVVPLARWGLGKLNHAAWSPDGSMQALSTTLGVFVFDTKLFQLHTYLDTNSVVNQTEFSPDGKQLAVATQDGLVILYDTNTWAIQKKLSRHTRSVNCLSYSKDNQWIASGAEDNNIIIWDLSAGTSRIFSGHLKGVNTVQFSPGGVLLASGSGDLTVKIWDTKTGQVLKNLAQSSAITSLAFFQDGTRVVTGSGERILNVWDVRSGKNLPAFRGSIISQVTSVAFSPDGKFVAAGETNGNVTIWDSTNQVIQWTNKNARIDRVLGANAIYLNSVAFSPDGKLLSSAVWDNTIIHYDVLTGKAIRVLDAYSDFVTKVRFSPDSSTLLAQTYDGRVKVWDIQKGKVRFSLPGYISPGQPFTLDSKYVALKMNDSQVRFYSLTTGAAIYNLTGHKKINNITVSEKYIGVRDGQDVRIWAIKSGLEIITHMSYISGCTYAFDEQNKNTIATGSVANLVRFGTYGQFCKLSVPSWARSLYVVRDQTWLAIAGPSVVMVFRFDSIDTRVRTGKPSAGDRDLVGFSGKEALSVVLTDDHEIAIAGLNDNSIKTWIVQSSEEAIILVGHQMPVEALDISPDGRLLASASMDGTIQLWGVH